MNYESTAAELSRRIYDLIPSHPEILDLESPFSLFKIDGFRCDDLQPSLAQAAWALGDAKGRYEGRSLGKSESEVTK